MSLFLVLLAIKANFCRFITVIAIYYFSFVFIAVLVWKYEVWTTLSFKDLTTTICSSNGSMIQVKKSPYSYSTTHLDSMDVYYESDSDLSHLDFRTISIVSVDEVNLDLILHLLSQIHIFHLWPHVLIEELKLPYFTFLFLKELNQYFTISILLTNLIVFNSTHASNWNYMLNFQDYLLHKL